MNMQDIPSSPAEAECDTRPRIEPLPWLLNAFVQPKAPAVIASQPNFALLSSLMPGLVNSTLSTDMKQYFPPLNSFDNLSPPSAYLGQGQGNVFAPRRQPSPPISQDLVQRRYTPQVQPPARGISKKRGSAGIPKNFRGSRGRGL